jgi:6-phosphogluconolactonase
MSKSEIRNPKSEIRVPYGCPKSEIRNPKSEMGEVFVTADPEALAREAAERVTEIAPAAVARWGRFSFVLSGGSTPKRLYMLLAAEPYRSRIPWGKTHVFWGDERAVAPEHPDSNFGMAMSALLARVPIPTGQVHRMQAERADRDEAAREYQAGIAGSFGMPRDGEPPRFDLILLGMGADGHTASLFPRTEALRERRRWVVANHVPQLGADRLTLTSPILNRGKTILFLVAGSDKAPVLHEALEGPPDPEKLPAQLIRPAEGRLIWLVDGAAASRLTGRRE